MSYRDEWRSCMIALLNIVSLYIFQTHPIFSCCLEMLFNWAFFEFIVFNMYFLITKIKHEVLPENE